MHVHTQGISECYECQPKPAAKTFPGCTIRNTPSEPIHCIVWAKHLFSQLFGEPDADNDVSPETEDSEGGEGEGEKMEGKSCINLLYERPCTFVGNNNEMRDNKKIIVARARARV
jgi:ubiquitin-like 1-activating enzyme E1 B